MGDNNMRVKIYGYSDDQIVIKQETNLFTEHDYNKPHQYVLFAYEGDKTIVTNTGEEISIKWTDDKGWIYKILKDENNICHIVNLRDSDVDSRFEDKEVDEDHYLFISSDEIKAFKIIDNSTSYDKDPDYYLANLQAEVYLNPVRKNLYDKLKEIKIKQENEFFIDKIFWLGFCFFFDFFDYNPAEAPACAPLTKAES